MARLDGDDISAHVFGTFVVLRLPSFLHRRDSAKQFVDLVKLSGLVTDSELAQFFANLNQRPLKYAQELADLFVQSELLNQWQADNLLKGKYKGFLLGEYRLLGHLCNGSMSTVFVASRLRREQLVTVKVLPKRYSDNENYVARFKREATVTAAIVHPNIVRTYELGQTNDRLYMVMEYVAGRDLQQIVDEDGPLTVTDAAAYIAQSAVGLQHCHDAGLIHRDVKPANLVLDSQHRIKLFDLGLARFSETDTDGACEFLDDAVVGTANYIAPEQAVDSQTVDCRADVYSLGCTLYFLLTGRPPFPHGTIAERLLQHQNEEPQSIYESRNDVPSDVVTLCQRMMSKSPDDRIQSAHLVAEAVNAVA